MTTPEADRKIPPEAGKTSYDLIDADLLFREIGLGPGGSVLDLGCGPGLYTLHAARLVGGSGRVTAVDLWPEGVERLRLKAAELGLGQVEALVGDIVTEPPLGGPKYQVILMATVLHDLAVRGDSAPALAKAAGLLESTGRLAMVEFKVLDGKPGPPKEIRLSPEQVEEMAAAHGFVPKKVVSLGPYNYLALFGLGES